MEAAVDTQIAPTTEDMAVKEIPAVVDESLVDILQCAYDHR